LVSKISAADDDTDVVTLESIFEDYIELSKCSAKKSILFLYNWFKQSSYAQNVLYLFLAFMPAMSF